MEIIEREFLGRLLVCAEANKRGWGCIIGTKKAILENIDRLPKGTVLLKSIIISELPYLKTYRSQGHKLVCLDEEGLIQTTLDDIVDMRVQPETMAELENFMVWGDIQHSAFKRKIPEFREKYSVVGNPRVDAWSKPFHALYNDEVERLVQKFGEYIIVPTSFAMYNHYMGPSGATDILKIDNMVDEAGFQYQLRYSQYVKTIYHGFMELIPKLATHFPNHSVIIRPHPSENRQPWDELASTYPNMYVEYQGSVSPWLLGAKIILHCGSTTAVEGNIMGKPVISYCPCSDDEMKEFDLPLPAQASIQLFDQTKVIDMVGQILENSERFSHDQLSRGHEALKQWIRGLGEASSALQVMDVIEGVGKKEFIQFNWRGWKRKYRFNIKEHIWYLLNQLCRSNTVKNLMPARIQHGLNSRRYEKHKTGKLTEAEIRHYIDQISNLKKQPTSSVHYLQHDLYCLTPKED